jgi:hypothetical protein
MDWDDIGRSSNIITSYFLRIFWKKTNLQDAYLQIQVSKVAMNQFLNEVDRGISGAFYKIVDANKHIHRINKYSIRNTVVFPRIE